MRSFRNPLAGVAALTVALGLAATVGPAAGASTVMPATGQRQNAGCPAGTVMTNAKSAGYRACAPVKESFIKVMDHTVIPNIPVCNECVARATVGIEMGNNVKSASLRAAGSPPEAADGILIEQAAGVNSYFAFWALRTTTGNLMIHPMKAVHVGDVTNAQVAETGTSVTFTVTDHTHPAGSFTLIRSCACTFTTADWAVSALPVGTGTGYYPLPNFGTWKITQASANTSAGPRAISGFGWTKLTLVNQASPPNVLATAGPLNATGDSFIDKWIAAS